MRKYPFKESEAGGEGKRLLFVDVGYASTNVAVLRLDPPPAKKSEAEATAEAARRFEVLAERSDGALGCADFDAAIFAHFAAQIEAKHGEPVVGGTRRGLRLLTAIERVRKLLSTMPEASATAENLIDGIDVPIKLSRDELAELLAPLSARLRALFDGLLATEGLQPLDGVEALGGAPLQAIRTHAHPNS